MGPPGLAVPLRPNHLCHPSGRPDRPRRSRLAAPESLAVPLDRRRLCRPSGPGYQLDLAALAVQPAQLHPVILGALAVLRGLERPPRPDHLCLPSGLVGRPARSPRSRRSPRPPRQRGCRSCRWREGKCPAPILPGGWPLWFEPPDRRSRLRSRR